MHLTHLSVLPRPVTLLWLQGELVYLEGSCNDNEWHDSLTKQWWGGSEVIRKGIIDFGDTQEMYTSSPCLRVLPLKSFLNTLPEISHLPHALLALCLSFPL